MHGILIAAALWAGVQTVPSDSFASRVAQGRQAEQTESGQAYQKRLWERLNSLATDALKGCIAATPSPDKSPFTVVADISALGQPQRVQVRPQTIVAACFAQRFAQMDLPVPPLIPTLPTYPIEIDISMTR